MRVKSKKADGGMVELSATVTAKEVDDIFSQTRRGVASQLGVEPGKAGHAGKTDAEKAVACDFEDRVAQGVVEAMTVMAIDQAGIIPAYYPPVKQEKPLEQGKVFSFSVEVMPKPAYELSSYDPVEIELPKPDITDEEVDAKCMEVLGRFKTFAQADPHPLKDGDDALLRVEASVNGEKLKGLCTGEGGLHYRVGAGSMPPGFDEEVAGMELGESKSFAFQAPDFGPDGKLVEITVDCSVSVIECQEEAQPQLTDAWISEHAPIYKDVEEVRADARRGLEREKLLGQRALGCRLAAAELASRFVGRIDDRVYEDMQRTAIGKIGERLRTEGKTFDDFKEEVGEQQANMQVMMETRYALREGYSLDAVARHEGLELTDEDIEMWCREAYPGVEPAQVRKGLEHAGRGFMMREGAMRFKANRWVFDHAKVKWTASA